MRSGRQVDLERDPRAVGRPAGRPVLQPGRRRRQRGRQLVSTAAAHGVFDYLRHRGGGLRIE
eukprot:5574687-Prymnesium_polylepis.1